MGTLSIDKKGKKLDEAKLDALLNTPASKSIPDPKQSKNEDTTSTGKIEAAITPAKDAPAKPKSPPSRMSGKKKPFVTAGQRFDHWSKYLAIDWIWNATASAGFAYWAEFTHSGKKIFGEPVTKAFDTILTPFIKNPQNRAVSVGWGKSFTGIITGGLMFTIPPLLIVENKKVKTWLVKTYDRLWYGKDKVENDPKFQQAYEGIQNAPEKGFWPNFWSRYIALAPLLASVLYNPKPPRWSSAKWLDDNVFTHVGTGTKKILSTIGLTRERLFGKFNTPELNAIKEGMDHRWEYINKNALGMDLTFGLPYAIMHAFWYNKLADTFAGWKAKKKDKGTVASPEKSADIPAPVSTAAEVSPPAPVIKNPPAADAKSSLEQKYPKKTILPPQDTHAKDLKTTGEIHYAQGHV